MTSRSGVVGGVAFLRFLAAGREVRTMQESKARGTEDSAMVNAGDGQPSSGASLIPPDRDHEVDSLDAVAGSEFVDDRIRLRE